MTAPDLAAIIAELTPHTLTLEEECRAREGFDFALRMRLHHMQAKVRSLPRSALVDVLLSVHIYAASIEATIAENERSSASPKAASTLSDRHMSEVGV